MSGALGDGGGVVGLQLTMTKKKEKKSESV